MESEKAMIKKMPALKLLALFFEISNILLDKVPNKHYN